MSTDEFEVKVKVEVLKRLESSAELVRQRMVALLSTSGEPAANAPPRKRTGELIESIRVKIDPDLLRAEIGSELFKAYILERGTLTRPPHPFARQALLESLPTIRREFGK